MQPPDPFPPPPPGASPAAPAATAGQQHTWPAADIDAAAASLAALARSAGA